MPHLAAENERTLATIRKHLDQAAFLDAWQRGRALAMDEAIDVALESLDR